MDEEDQAPLTRREVTINRLVGFNMRWFRERAGVTQSELGERLGGWSKVVVSAAERSWTSDRVRQFTGDEIVAVAGALGVPVIALLLPPPDSGVTADYAFAAGSASLETSELLALVVTDYQGDSAGMAAFRDRLAALGGDRLAGLAARQVEEREHVAEEAERMLTDARRLSERITADSRARAESLERDAQERHRQAMRNLIPAREALERRVDDLRVFEREYRSRLLAYLKSQVAELEADATGSGVFPAIAATEPPADAGPEGRRPSYPQEPEET